MIAIGTNASALMAQATTASVQIDAETAMQRLSSGKRINNGPCWLSRNRFCKNRWNNDDLIFDCIYDNDKPSFLNFC